MHICGGSVRINGDGHVTVKVSHPAIEMQDQHGTTIFNAKDEGARDDYSYRVALIEVTVSSRKVYSTFQHAKERAAAQSVPRKPTTITAGL